MTLVCCQGTRRRAGGGAGSGWQGSVGAKLWVELGVGVQGGSAALCAEGGWPQGLCPHALPPGW